MAMAMKTLIARLRGGLRTFVTAREGNVAIIFALASLPIVGLVGASIDYSRANSIKADLQSSLDATALMLSKSAATMTSAQLKAAAQAYFQALFNRSEAATVDLNVSYTTDNGSSVTVSGVTSVKPQFIGVVPGMQNIPINSSSTVNWGMTKLRVALVLDNTGSMADNGKMSALKTATHQLLTTLKNASTTTGDVQVAIVPFSKDVNVGAGNYTADWVDWSDWEDDNGHDTSTQTCTTTKTGKNGKTSKKCTTTTTWVPDNHNTWNGCVTDRDQDFDTLNTTPKASDKNLPDTSPSTLFPAEQYGSCPVAMLPMSYSWTALNNLVDQMQPAGNTNQMIGLAWGWQALTQGAPLFPPAVTDTTTQQVLILLTDGMNTENRWSTNQADIDARQVKTCNNIKAAGVQIYTVLVMAGNSTVLQNCASKANMYFALTTSGQIVTAFNTIGTNLAQLRVAK
jgi:Flp pilus assembly protein TadG